MALNIGAAYYGISRDSVQQINLLAARIKAHNAAIQSDVFGGLFTINRWNAAAIDAMAATVDAVDHLGPRIFATADGVGAGHFHALNREKVAALIALEARATALGW